MDQGVFTNADLDQILIYGAAVEPLSPARSVGLVRDKLVKELRRVTSLPLGWRHFNESESSNPHPVWGLIRDLENSTARAEAFLIKMSKQSVAEDVARCGADTTAKGRHGPSQRRRRSRRSRRIHAEQESLVVVATGEPLVASMSQAECDELVAELARAREDIQYLRAQAESIARRVSMDREGEKSIGAASDLSNLPLATLSQ